MTWKYRYRKQIIICTTILVFLCIGITFYITEAKQKKKKETSEILLTKKEKDKDKEVKQKEEKKEVEKIMVDIKGEVLNPGIYTLDKTSRVIDVINMAGGLTQNGDTSVLNLSKKVVDEMVIIVYSYYEVQKFSYIKEKEKQVQTSCKEGVNEIENDACIEINQEEDEKESIVSINNATKEELMTLPGIGESKAEAIIKYREENGEFKTIEEIKNVNGIGDSLFDKIKENITL